MPPDNRTNEQLVEAYRNSEPPALDVLFKRYLVPLLSFLYNHSFFWKDEDYLIEVRDEVFLKACEGLRKPPEAGGFASKGPGSFSAWLFAIAKLECLNADKKRRRAFLPLSQAFPTKDRTDSDDESSSPLDNILFRTNSEPDETEDAQLKLERAFKILTPHEIELLQLSVKMKYKDIIKLKEFSKYKTIDNLKHKVHNVMEKIRKCNHR